MKTTLPSQPVDLPTRQLSEADCLARVAEMQRLADKSKDPDLRRRYSHETERWTLLSRLAAKAV
jgi:hypothetical protein